MQRLQSQGQVNKPLAESFLVSQLKKQNRQARLDYQQKQEECNYLKRNIKLSRSKEQNSDLQTYVEEC